VTAPTGETVCVSSQLFSGDDTSSLDHEFWTCLMETLSLRRAAVLCSFAVIASIPGVAETQAQTLTVTPTSIAAGGSVTASWSNIASPTSTDWIGLYSSAAANNAFHAWMYVSCTQHAGAARASGSCSFVVPSGLAAGTYQLRLLANDGFAVRATSNNFTVTTGGGGVGGGSSPGGGSVSAVFTPSADHNTLVRHYVLDIFPSSADHTVANAVLSVDLGKPSVVNGECYVDITAVLAQLWPGTFIGTVSAIGDEGGAQSEPSAAFVIP
jgi:hypothetical protein